MDDIRIMIAFCPTYGKELARELIKLKDFSMCYLADGLEENDPDPNIINFYGRIASTADYEKVIDLNLLPALSKNLMEKMLPYESMAIKLSMRETNFPISDYEEKKREYHKHLRFWNYIINKYGFNLIFFGESPIESYLYVIYGLAKIHNIPVLMCNQTNIFGVRPYGHSIMTIGENIGEYYENVAKNMDPNECVLTGGVKDYFDRFCNGFLDVKQERIKNNYGKTELKRVKKSLYGRSIHGLSFVIKTTIKKIKDEHKDLSWFMRRIGRIKRYRLNRHRIKFFMRHMAMTQKQYNKIAEEPDYEKKYIYYGLQLTPEETTMPRAGVFSEQYTSVQLLARAAEKEGVYVYVKEHFVQAFRDKEVYNSLRTIPNVKLIKMDVSSYDLMSHGIAAATQTGSCILEGVLMGKPVLVTSSGSFWKGLPGVYEVVDEEQGRHIINGIKSGYTVDLNDVKKYFYAIQENTLSCYNTNPEISYGSRSEHKQSVYNMVELIRNYAAEL